MPKFTSETRSAARQSQLNMQLQRQMDEMQRQFEHQLEEQRQHYEDQLSKVRRRFRRKIREQGDKNKQIKKELTSARRKLAASKFRKPLDQLGRNQFARRFKEEQQRIGSGYQLMPTSNLVLTSKDCNSIRRIYRLSGKRYEAIARLTGTKWDSLSQVRSSEKRLVEACGGIETSNEDGVNMVWVADPAKVLQQYVLNLMKIAWDGHLLEHVHLVVGGDKDTYILANFLVYSIFI
jgi:hypothetical protein